MRTLMWTRVMTMAHIWRTPESPTAPAVSQPRDMQEALAALRLTLADEVNDGSGNHGSALERLKSDVRLLCVVARQEHVAPERMLVQLKQTLQSAPSAGFLENDRREETDRAVVEYAIHAYFTDGQ